MRGPLESFEMGPIRPPSEAFSLLIRATRNCPWNRCRFCPIYKGEKFELRPVNEIMRDIDAARIIRGKIKEMAWISGREAAAMVFSNPPNEAYRNMALWLYAGGKQAFLQDANTLVMKTGEMVEVLKYLKEAFPSISRITSYGRSHTAARKSPEELESLREAGLSRLHIGLESGYDPVLKLVDKGVTAADHIAGGKNITASGISLSEYVILGLGGKAMWREHAQETARVLNEINPDYIRFRTLTIRPGVLLYDNLANGSFTRATDDEIIEEEKLLIQNLNCRSNIASDHITNLLQEVEGKLPEDKEKILAVIERYQSLEPDAKDNYKIGRRLGLYSRLDDMENTQRHAEVDQVLDRLRQSGDGSVDEAVFSLIERYI